MGDACKEIMQETAPVAPEQIATQLDAVLRDLLAPAAKLEVLKRRELLTSEEVEALYGIPSRTLSGLRQKGRGPRYIQEVERGPVYYSHPDINAYLNKCRKRTHE